MSQEVGILEMRKKLTTKKCDRIDSTIETKKHISEFEDSTKELAQNIAQRDEEIKIRANHDMNN